MRKLLIEMLSVMVMGLIIVTIIFTVVVFRIVPKLNEQPVPKEPTIEVVFEFNRPRNGSVLFWQGGLLVKPILKNTGSTITHAAVILNGYVYEASPPCVHRVPLADYLKEMMAKHRRDFTWFIMEPQTPYTPVQTAKMKLYATSQLGRPYTLRGWWRGREVRGIFCSQYVANVLEKSGRIKSGSFRESPGSLYEKLKPIYQGVNP